MVGLPYIAQATQQPTACDSSALDTTRSLQSSIQRHARVKRLRRGTPTRPARPSMSAPTKSGPGLTALALLVRPLQALPLDGHRRDMHQTIPSGLEEKSSSQPRGNLQMIVLYESTHKGPIGKGVPGSDAALGLQGTAHPASALEAAWSPWGPKKHPSTRELGGPRKPRRTWPARAAGRRSRRPV